MREALWGILKESIIYASFVLGIPWHELLVTGGGKTQSYVEYSFNLYNSFSFCAVSGFVFMAPWEANESLISIHISGEVINAFFFSKFKVISNHI